MGEGLEKKLHRTFSRSEPSFDEPGYQTEEDGFSDSGFFETTSHITLRSSKDKHAGKWNPPYSGEAPTSRTHE